MLSRLYSGMKVRCIYHSELLDVDRPALTPEAGRAKAEGRSCSWRGAMHDYESHLDSCQVHALMTGSSPAAPSTASSAGSAPVPTSPVRRIGSTLTASAPPFTMPPVLPAQPVRPEQAWTQITGAFQVLSPWHSLESGSLCMHPGAVLWVTSSDASGEWAYARSTHVPPLYQGDAAVHAWVPRSVLQRAVYPACSGFDAQGQPQGLSLQLGNCVHVYLREASGWTYGARLSTKPPHNAPLTPEAVGWFPEACIAEPVPLFFR